MLNLHNEWVITIPTTVEVNEPVSPVELAQMLNHVQHAMSNRFGGCTSTEAQGCYVSEETGELVRETVYRVMSLADVNPEETIKQDKFMRLLAEYIKNEFSQECVLIENNIKHAEFV